MDNECSPRRDPQDIAHYETFRGVVLGPEEGHAIATALGGKKAAILSNHGLLTCGGTVESCVRWFMSLEGLCETQLLADAAAAGRGGVTVKIAEEEAAETHRTIGTDIGGWFSAQPVFVMMEHECGNDYKM